MSKSINRKVMPVDADWNCIKLYRLGIDLGTFHRSELDLRALQISTIEN
jgi:hypothetical protein